MHSRCRRFVTRSLCISLLAAACVVEDPPPSGRDPRAARHAHRDPPRPGLEGGRRCAGPVPDNWLASFDDPQLDALVAEAIANNPDLRVTAARVEQAAQYVGSPGRRCGRG